MGSMASTQPEKELARKILAAEQRARAAVKGHLAVEQLLANGHTKGSERTRAGEVERLGKAISMARSEHVDDPALLRCTKEALEALAEAEQLRWQLALSQQRIAYGEANKLRRSSLDVEDLAQEGFIGLLRAAMRYDPERDIQFATYARWWVRAQMTRAIDNDSRMVRLPGGAIEQLRNLRKSMEEHHKKQARSTPVAGEEGIERPDLSEIAARANMDLARAQFLLSQGRFESLNQPVSSNDERSWESILADEDASDPYEQVVMGERVAHLMEAFDVLDERQQRVLFLRYGLHDGVFHSLSSIARELKLSRERVRQIERQALALLRDKLPDQDALEATL